MKREAPPPVRRGRPRSFDRQEALCAALRLFRERGYEGTSTADLQKALGGISPPSLYAAFGSKDQLFKEAVELYRSRVGVVTARAISDAPTTKDAIAAMLRAAVATMTEQGEPRGCLLVQGALACSPSNEETQRYLHEARLENQRNILALLKKGVASGDVPEQADVAALASFFATLAHGLGIQARDGVSRASMLAAVDCAMAVWDTLVPARVTRR